MTYHEAVKELYFWQHSNLCNFHGLLYTLISKADANNFARLMLAFPAECLAWAEWSNAPDPEAWFIGQGLFDKK